MQRAGEWVRPTLQGEAWLEKPPLYYWLAGAAFRILGETETAARLPSVLAGLALVGVTTLVGTRLFGRAAGLHAGFVLAAAFLPVAYARSASMDALLAATVTTAIGLLALCALGIAGRLAVPVAYAFMGLATLAKGPLGLLLAGLQVRRSRTDLFLLGWFLLPFLFFSLAGSKLPGYILPCLPPLALLMGRAAARLTRGEGGEEWWGAPRAVSLVGLVLGALLV